MDHLEIKRALSYPLDVDFIMRKQRSIERTLAAKEGLLQKKIAILGGSTTSEIKNLLKIFLLQVGIAPSFYESEYNRYYEESVYPNQAMETFEPDIVLIHTTFVNLKYIPQIHDSKEKIYEKIEAEFSYYKEIWNCLRAQYHCVIIQNNFEFPDHRTLGNQDGVDCHGIVHYINVLNQKFSAYAAEYSDFYMHDICYLAARNGLNVWHDPAQYYAYKFAMSYACMLDFSYSVAQLVKGLLGKSKKCLVLDLDNTLWGGVIGDDGVSGIHIGRETPEGEAYVVFQKYVLALKKRGIILAVCSKNDEKIAKEGFSHPDSILAVQDFTVFKANWQPKHHNILEIAQEINIGLDSMVFVDDNPVERQIVRENLPEVAVPEVDGNEIAFFLRTLDQAGYFETGTISGDDLIRAKSYAQNSKRKELQRQFIAYDDFLLSLEMKAEIASFQPIYMDRITQLTNKSNQFNLTTRRYTVAEISSIMNDPNYIALYGRLTDKFGDNGLVSVVIGQIKEDELHMDLWLMSCRVLKRGMEAAMFDALVDIARKRGIKKMVGYYYPSKKNGMVAGFYKDFEFQLVEQKSGNTTWEYEIQQECHLHNKWIEVMHSAIRSV